MTIVAHEHANILTGGRLYNVAFDSTSTVSLAGSIAFGFANRIYLTFNAYMWWPMLHSDGVYMIMIPHNTDGGSADAPRAGLVNNEPSTTRGYDLDYRYIAVS